MILLILFAVLVRLQIGDGRTVTLSDVGTSWQAVDVDLNGVGILAGSSQLQIWDRVIASAPVGTRTRPLPPYYRDPRFQIKISTQAGFLEPADLKKAMEGIPGVAFAFPGFVAERSLHLPEGERSLRDALDALADLAQGEWKKVGAAYVLVVPPELLEAAEMEPRIRAERSQQLLKALIISLAPRQRQRLSQGNAFSLGTANPLQRRYLIELGMLGYYELPVRRDPEAIRGEGVTLAFHAEAGKQTIELWLPTRAGTPRIWLKEELATPAPAP